MFLEAIWCIRTSWMNISNYNVPPKYIEFELTESLVMENSEILVEIINQIHKFGCTCSIDDFGSGYSSLNMLKEFDFDVIKLDQVFFRGSNGFDDKAKKIVHSVIELCHTLNKTIVAEGVENKEIVNIKSTLKEGMNQIQETCKF